MTWTIAMGLWRYMAPGMLVGMMIGCAPNQDAYQAALREDAQKGTGLFRQEDLPALHRPDPDSSEAALWEIMDGVEQQLRLSGKVSRDAALTTYLHDLVCRLAPRHCGEIRVYVTRQPAFNAFMAPNGMMEIWDGVFLRVRNEAQLAAILGHELGHYLRRHALQRYETTRAKRKAMALLSVATGLAGIPLAVDVADYFTTGGLMAYERDQEREADGLGIKLMADAGYDTREAGKVWALIAELAALTAKEKDTHSTSMFSSHPVSLERSQELERLAQALGGETSDRVVGLETWQEVLRPRRVQLLQDEAGQNRPAATALLLERLLEDGEDGALLFFLGQSYYHRGGDGDGARTLTTLKRALDLGYNGMAVLQVSALICLQPNRPREACAELGQAASAQSIPVRLTPRYHRHQQDED